MKNPQTSGQPDFDAVIKQNPRDTQAFLNRALAYKDLRDYERAVGDLGQALKIDPGFSPAITHRGLIYFTKGDIDHAIEDFDRAIQVNPKDAEAYNNRGIAYRNKGRTADARRSFEKAVSMSPGLIPAREELADLYGAERRRADALDQPVFTARQRVVVVDLRASLQCRPGRARCQHRRRIIGDGDPHALTGGDRHGFRRDRGSGRRRWDSARRAGRGGRSTALAARCRPWCRCPPGP